ncbi:GntR family transcriptional regulator [Flaviflagellibacter deserti]|uniref:GntR family transcriptional regulator n=1 Tax=Flaviflagellibacter deserti TaxID=2267266 RepID=A0ABV9Z415_9HYPH
MKLETFSDGAVVWRDGTSNAPDRSRQVRDALQAAIVDHRLAPSTKLSEDEVGEAFGVSRTVVRAALQGLSHAGLVTLERNRGAFVASPGAQEARQVFDARRLIEPDIARASARNYIPKNGKLLRDHCSAEAEALKAGDRRNAIRLSGEFHLKLADIGGNLILARFLGELIARSSLIIALYGRSGVSVCGMHEHRAIISALAAKDEDKAAALMIEHLDHIDHDLDLERNPPSPRPLSELLDL